jgi:hypothetical protein
MKPTSGTCEPSSTTKKPSQRCTSLSAPPTTHRPLSAPTEKSAPPKSSSFYFPSTISASDKDAIMSSVNKMRPVVERSEALSVYDGWALEEAVPNPGPHASEGEMSKVYVNLVGWVDVEAHMRFQGSEDFQQNTIHHLLGIKELRHTDFSHVKLHAVL